MVVWSKDLQFTAVERQALNQVRGCQSYAPLTERSDLTANGVLAWQILKLRPRNEQQQHLRNYYSFDTEFDTDPRNNLQNKDKNLTRLNIESINPFVPRILFLVVFRDIA